MFNKKPDKLDEIFNDCLDSMINRCEDIEDCLARYPEHAGELRPLLQTAVLARKAAAIEPSPEFRARARYQFNSMLAESAAKKQHRPLAWQRNFALAASLSLMMILSGGGVVAASGKSMPDSPLYQVKLAIEQAQIFLTPSTAAKADLYAKLADKRVTEIINMAKEGNAALVKSTTARLASDLSMITTITANDLVQWGPVTGSYSPPTATSAAGLVGGQGSESATITQTVGGGGSATPTVTKTTTAGATKTIEVTSTTTTSPAPTTQAMTPPDKSQTTDGERLSIVPACPGQDNFACRFSGESASNLDALYAALEGAPEDVRQALLEAIQVLVGGYNDALNAGIEAAS